MCARHEFGRVRQNKNRKNEPKKKHGERGQISSARVRRSLKGDRWKTRFDAKKKILKIYLKLTIKFKGQKKGTRSPCHPEVG